MEKAVIASSRVDGHRIRWVVLLAALLAACRGGPSEGGASEAGLEVEERVGEDDDAPTDLVTLSEAAFATAGIETLAAESRAVARGAVNEIIPGRVEFDPARVALISPRTFGRIERLAAVEGQTVEEGEPVAYLLSNDFLVAQHDYSQAVRRAEGLVGTPEEAAGRQLVEAAERRLRLLGVEQTFIDRLATEGVHEDFLPVTAPFGGRIVTAHLLAGAAVEVGTPIFTLADLTMVDIAAAVPERVLGRLRVGQEVSVDVPAFPGRAWTGRVARVKDELDRDTRTATALIRVANGDGSLRPGMFASIRLGLPPDARSEPTVVVPESAVVTDGESRSVFVEVDVRTYRRRPVQVEVVPGLAGWLAIPSGLSAGEPVVVRGAFTLKSELAKASFGDVD